MAQVILTLEEYNQMVEEKRLLQEKVDSLVTIDDYYVKRGEGKIELNAKVVYELALAKALKDPVLMEKGTVQSFEQFGLWVSGEIVKPKAKVGVEGATEEVTEEVEEEEEF